MPRDELEAWIPLKVGARAVQKLERPDLWRHKLNTDARNSTPFADDPPGSWAGDEIEVPLWLSTLSQALTGAVFVPAWLTLAEAVRLVEHDAERRDGLSVIARLGALKASSVVAQLIDWREES